MRPSSSSTGARTTRWHACRRQTGRSFGSARRDALAAGVADGLGIVVAGVTVVAVLAAAVSAQAAGDLDRVLVAALTLLALASFEAVAPLSLAARELSTTLAAGRRVLELTDREPAVQDPPSPARAPPARPALALEGVSARDTRPASRSPSKPPSFRLDPGRRVALVGPSGAGKTTVVNLLLRFLDPEEGRVTLAGRDLREYRQEDVRQAIAVAGQDSHLFSTSIRENVRLARPAASDAERRERLAPCAPLDVGVLAPRRLDTLVGEAGRELSGGQRQRLVLARALLADAPLLVLDEPTAHLDPETAEALIADILTAADDRSVLLITHRQEGLELVDEIVVLAEGRTVPSAEPPIHPGEQRRRLPHRTSRSYETPRCDGRSPTRTQVPSRARRRPYAVEHHLAPGLVLISLILVAAVANLNLSVANVALPDIGKAFDSSQVTLNLIAVGYSLGLAASVLYLGAIGDRYGRKLHAHPRDGAGDPDVAARRLRALRRGALRRARRRRSRRGHGIPDDARPDHRALVGAGADEVDRAVVGASAARSQLSARCVSGALLEDFWWGSVFLITLPLAVAALVMAFLFVPSHVNEATDPVDNLGGILSVLLVAALILAINFAPVPNEGALVLGLAVIALAAERLLPPTAPGQNPLYDLDVAGRRIFWVAACAGIIVFGSLMGAMFVGQQFLQNVLGYSTLEAGASILPAAALMVLVAPRSAKLVEARGARFTLLAGYVFLLLAFLTMLLLWKEDIAYWQVGLALRFHRDRSRARGHAGLALADRLGARDPRRNGIGNRRPPARPRRRDHAVDLRRAPDRGLCDGHGGGDRGVGQATSRTASRASSRSPSPEPRTSPSSIRNTPTRSLPRRSPPSSRGTSGRTRPGSSRSQLGAALVFFLFPRKEEEEELLAAYHAADASRAGSTGTALPRQLDTGAEPSEAR